MSMLSGFKPFNFNEGVPYVSVTTNGVTFNKSVVMKLDYPEHVVLLIDEEGKRIAIQACGENTENAAQFYKPKKNDAISDTLALISACLYPRLSSPNASSCHTLSVTI